MGRRLVEIEGAEIDRPASDAQVGTFANRVTDNDPTDDAAEGLKAKIREITENKDLAVRKRLTLITELIEAAKAPKDEDSAEFEVWTRLVDQVREKLKDSELNDALKLDRIALLAGHVIGESRYDRPSDRGLGRRLREAGRPTEREVSTFLRRIRG